MLHFIKNIIKGLLPSPMVSYIRGVRARRYGRKVDKTHKGKNIRDIFSDIYSKGLWGNGDIHGGFHSGHGSHDALYVASYIEGVKEFLLSFPSKQTVVDLGCGDFNIGHQLVEHSSKYIGCDVVPSLIEFHRNNLTIPSLEFRVVDITVDSLPQGDIAIIRQVLQHLSNKNIQAFLENLLSSTFTYIIVTEHIPHGNFIPNIDQPTGACSRMARGIKSGIVLSEPPFNLKVITEQLVVDSVHQNNIIRTIAYQLK
jgi:hypothetical protein